MSTIAAPERLTTVMVLTCSTRPGALGPSVSRWFVDATKQIADEFQCALVTVSLADVALPMYDETRHPAEGGHGNEHTRAWAEMVGVADAFVVVIPEYNHGIPASFKNALDYLYDEWAWKAVGFVSYGNTSAGTRSVQHAEQITTALRMVAAGSTVALRIADCVENGTVMADERRDRTARELLGETVTLTRALRPMRQRGDDVPGLRGARRRRLTALDTGDVVTLQRCCWLDEAIANDTLDLPALTETPDDVEQWLSHQSWTCWGVWWDARLVAMVRARRDGPRWEIGRLATAPDVRGRGIAGHLLGHAENAAPLDCSLVALTTGSGSVGNIAFYSARGFRRDESTSTYATVRMVKPRGDASISR